MLTLNGKLMLVMLPQDCMHGAESATTTTLVIRRRGIRRMMKELKEEFMIINADEEGEDWLLN